MGTHISMRWSPVAILIKRVYEIDPLTCPHCGNPMKVVAFIEPLEGDPCCRSPAKTSRCKDHGDRMKGKTLLKSKPVQVGILNGNIETNGLAKQ